MSMRMVAMAIAIGFVSAPSLAADPVRPAPIPVPVVKQDFFSGFYLGGHAGYGTATRTGCATYDGYHRVLALDVQEEEEYGPCEYGTDFDYQQKGWLVGGQVGVNHVVGSHSLLLGAEVSASLTGMTGNLSLHHFGDGVGDWHYLATATGKVGFVMNKVAIYGEAGVAVGAFSYNSTLCSFDSNHQGLVYGAGIEFAHNSNNTVFLKYDHIDFQEKDAKCGIPFIFPLDVKTKPTLDIIKFGFNHYFH